MKRKLFKQSIVAMMLLVASQVHAFDVNGFSFKLSLKQPGDKAATYPLTRNGNHLTASAQLPMTATYRLIPEGEDMQLVVTLQASERVYYNLGVSIPTDYATDDSEFYLPGFWYHKNLRSPREAPSFHTSKSWNFREDRLSSPLTGVYDSRSGSTLTVLRNEQMRAEALTTHQEGEIILGGATPIGYMGFDNENGRVSLTFGYPWVETPKRYIRKLTLVNPATTFACLEPGEKVTLSWYIRESKAKDYGHFVADTWSYCMDRINPQPINTLYSPEQMKAQMANYFRKAYVDKYALKYHSGSNLRCDDCLPADHVTLGFVGRVLLNAFNSLEYGEQTGEKELVDMGKAIFDSWLQYGFTAKGYFKEDMRISHGIPSDGDCIHSIRQQSEAVYAVLHYLNYEKQHGRQHKDWEQKMRVLLNQMLLLQKSDGSFPRKYRDDNSDFDASGGSTASAT